MMQSSAFSRIAIALLLIFAVPLKVTADELLEAKKILNQAFEVALRVEDESSRAELLRKIAMAQADALDVEGINETIAAMKNASDKAFALGHLGMSQAMAGDLKAARKTSSKIPGDQDKLNLLGMIALDQAFQGDMEGALKTASRI
ncbi:MAG TPA: hypothetical protein VJJ98_04540, partial [Sedimentisphaerales bacterium]|nr:hypothetical protein [Sedimentisphaerales bacterium]